MYKKKKGFTLVEIIATLAILGVSTAMFTIVVTNMSRAQSSAGSQYRFNTEIDEIDRVVKDYVSYVSLKTGDSVYGVNLSFVNVSSDNKTLTFADDNSCTYALSYADNKLSIVFTGETYCANQTSPANIPDVTNYSVAFDDSLSLIKINYEINGHVNHVSGVVRTNTNDYFL